ncbi:hypothetical protein [Haloquadratum walsbyi]|jgi:hypothetical protein|uniref:Uncharacterized protein n=1 Tax=Haloquadratum walsbyi J07HQW2 TaxID=1238425 RepID=U1MUL0_9EURY|nr:hypothetical protein [Haloquadratum walsbyi]ERG94034.1 MAG: hypothetical protein J07HQW2_00468 [Haloquadratum walsbyi J07HQW2]
MYHQRVREAVDELDTEFTREELRNNTSAPRTIVDDVIDEMHQEVKTALDELELGDKFTREELNERTTAPGPTVDDVLTELHRRGEVYQPTRGIWCKYYE